MNLTPNNDDAIAFLQWFAPEGPWNVVAIALGSDRHVSSDTFHPGNEEELGAFLTLKKAENIYFTVNPIRRALKKKPDRRDIKSLAWLHVDVDPRPREDVGSEQERIAKLLGVYKPRPSCVVFSGGGYQAFWRLDEPFPIDGKEDAYEEAKLWNKQLEILFDADHCHNVDRIMRLPGTVNWPTKRKVEKGRVPALAKVEWMEPTTYPLAQFQKATQLQQSMRAPSKAIKISGNVRRLESLDDLAINGLCKSVIGVGEHPDDPSHYSSRSEAVWWVTCEMVRSGIDDDTIFSIITDPDWAISGHVLSQPRPEEYAIRQIERARELAEDNGDELLRMNDQYSVVQVGGKARILQEPKNDDKPVTLMTERDLSLMIANRKVTWNDGKRDHSIPLMKWWIQHPKRRTFYDLVFLPAKKAPDNAYNLWRGFAHDSIPGDAEPFLSHLRDNICQNKPECYDYLIGWMAHAVQLPYEPGHVAVVLRSKQQGTGKGFMANTFGKLFGRHFKSVTNVKHIFGQFNGILEDCVVLFADEAFWAGSNTQKTALKVMITEPTTIIERKGMDAETRKNFVHLIMASNEDWVVPVEAQDRRFFVLDVGEDRMQDSRYFGDIADYMETQQGYEALLHFLMTYDLSGFDVRKFPDTEARRTQRKHSIGGFDEWWYGKLAEGRLLHDDWPSQAWCVELHADYLAHARSWEKNPEGGPTKLGVFMQRALGGRADYKKQAHAKEDSYHVHGDNGVVHEFKRPYYYETMTLEQCREIWEELHGPMEWVQVESGTPEEVESDGVF